MITAVQSPLSVIPADPSNYSRLTRTPTLVVLHSTEGGTATTVAAMFAKPLAPKRSAHYAVDAAAVIRCVPDANIAWHCGHQGNVRGIGIEIRGYAAHPETEWLASGEILDRAAGLVFALCSKYAIPVHFLDARNLRAGASGITTHAEVSLAWHETDHTDPGPNFPLDAFIGAVAAGYAVV